MRASRELLVLVALLLLLGVAVLVVRPTSDPPMPRLSSHSAAAGDALALYLWLSSVGYRVERLEYRDFRPSSSLAALLVLAPTERPDEAEIAALRGWVERGGTLILSGAPAGELPGIGALLRQRDPMAAFLEAFGMVQEALPAVLAEVSPSQPLLRNPTVLKVKADAERYVTGPAGLVPYLGDSERPVAAGLAVGRGKIYVLSSRYALSNDGLGRMDNAALLLNWLPPPGVGVVGFDEVHHGLVADRSLERAILREPWGWGVLYAVGVVFVFLALGGRRFGRAVAQDVDGRRHASDYVFSIASLLRRGQKSRWLAQHYERELRRQLASSFDLDPSLPPDTVAERLATSESTGGRVDGRAVGRLLAVLREGGKVDIREDRLLRIAEEADRMIKACSGRRR